MNIPKKLMLYDDVPAFCLIDFNPATCAFLFSLHPKANRFLEEMLKNGSPTIIWLETEYGFSPFIRPHEDGWGFGKVFSRHTGKPILKDWVTWECPLPKPSDKKPLQEISGSIYMLTNIMSIFEYDHANDPVEIPQFLTIDNLLAVSDNPLHASAFSFTYSRHVLDFCAKIWDRPGLRNAIPGSMHRVSSHLSGRTYRAYEFSFSESQGDSRLSCFKVPGNCACIGPHCHEQEGGAIYGSHNVGTKFQQLTLLAGVVTLAGLARRHWYVVQACRQRRSS